MRPAFPPCPHFKACEILVPWPGIEHWKYGVLTTELLGKSCLCFLIYLPLFILAFKLILLAAQLDGIVSHILEHLIWIKWFLNQNSWYIELKNF